jgi:hypothetical protein
MAHDPYWDLVHEPEEPAFDAAKTALLIIDMQNLCAHPEGWMGRLCVGSGPAGPPAGALRLHDRDHAQPAEAARLLPDDGVEVFTSGSRSARPRPATASGAC